jgi:LysR family transcriptional regulator, low CO2-responsive transcriptional regulator
MNFAYLRSFHAVATEGSFTRAATALGVTQPTLSTQVKALEERYGVALLHRRGRGVEPTELGRALLDVTRRLFSLEEEASELLARARGLSVGSLRIGADSPYHVMPFLAQFRAKYPEIRVSLSIGNAEEVQDGLIRHRADIAFLADAPEDERFAKIPCGRHPIMAFVAATHPWAAKKRIRFAELDGQPIVQREAGSMTRRVFEEAAAKAGIRVAAALETESREGVREAVAAGLGIGIVSEAEFGQDRRLVALGLADADIAMTENVVCLKERLNLRIVSAFLDIVRRKVA